MKIIDSRIIEGIPQLVTVLKYDEYEYESHDYVEIEGERYKTVSMSPRPFNTIAIEGHHDFTGKEIKLIPIQ